MTTGTKIQEQRKKQNITQEQLADYLGVSRQSVSKWESDTAYPETDKLIRIAALFHISLDFLLREDYEENEQKVKKTARMRFSTNAFIFVILAICGFILAVALAFITKKPWIGFLVFFTLSATAIILYVLVRSRFITHAEYSEQDQTILLKCTAMTYSVNIVGWMLFLPLLLFTTRVSISTPFGTLFLEHGILTFSSYLWLGFLFGVVGGMGSLLIWTLHRKKVLRVPATEIKKLVKRTDLAVSVLALLLGLLAYFPTTDNEGGLLVLLLLCLLVYLGIFPLVYAKKGLLAWKTLIPCLQGAVLLPVLLVLGFEAVFYSVYQGDNYVPYLCVLGAFLLSASWYLVMAVGQWRRAKKAGIIETYLLWKNGVFFAGIAGIQMLMSPILIQDWTFGLFRPAYYLLLCLGTIGVLFWWDLRREKHALPVPPPADPVQN